MSPILWDMVGICFFINLIFKCRPLQEPPGQGSWKFMFICVPNCFSSFTPPLNKHGTTGTIWTNQKHSYTHFSPHLPGEGPRQLQIWVGLSGHCRASTASSRSHWAMPDVPDCTGHCRTSKVRECQIPVGTAGPDLRAPDPSSGSAGPQPPAPDRMLDRMSEQMSDRMPEHMPHRMPNRIPDRMPDTMLDRKC